MEVKSSLRGWNPISRRAVRFGVPACALAFTACAMLYIAAGRIGDYYTLLRWCGELATCARDSLTAILASAMIGEIIARAAIPPSNDTINR
ncbi:MAG: hypothetical protein ACLU8W_08745 [Clostridia bacterium]|mgnify:CR=1 FL=1